MKNRIRAIDRDCRRRGLTLLEVLLSLGLFLGALAALSQLWYGGVRAAVQARLSTQAILRCESKLNEVVAGAVPLTSTNDTAFDDDASWTWSLQVESGTHHADALSVIVTVKHPGQGGLSSNEYQLRRLIRDPLVWTAAQQATTEETTP